MLGYIGNASAPLPAALAAEKPDACFIVREATGKELGHFYFEDEPQTPCGGQAAHHGRGMANGGEHRQAAGAAAPKGRRRPDPRTGLRLVPGPGPLSAAVTIGRLRTTSSTSRRSRRVRSAAPVEPTAKYPAPCLPHAASRRHGPSMKATPASSSATPTGRRSKLDSTMRFEANPTITTEEWHG